MNTLQILRDNVDQCIDCDGVFCPTGKVLDLIWRAWAEDNSYSLLVKEAVDGMDQSPSYNERVERYYFRGFARTLAEEHAAEIEQYHREVNAPDPMDYDDVGRMIG